MTNPTCNTCCRSTHAPYRRRDERGKIVEGCVDACHSEHVYGADAAWHNRPEARRIRKGLAAFSAR